MIPIDKTDFDTQQEVSELDNPTEKSNVDREESFLIF